MISWTIRLNPIPINRQISAELSQASEQIRNLVLAEIIAATPIDTGEARASWITRVISEEQFLLTNDEEYVKYLNAGSSSQAAAYFIEAVVLKYGRPSGAVVTYAS